MKIATPILILLALTFNLFAQPTTITWQGKLLDAGGNAITQNNVSMNFAMFDASASGNQLWPVSGVVTKTVNVIQGLYSVQLGTGTGDDIVFTAAMFNGKTPWLEVKVGTETLPRTEITNVPFALISNDLSASGWENPGEIGKTAPNTGKFTSVETGSMKITGGATAGKVLTSDVMGNATWQNPALTNFIDSSYIYESKTGVKLAVKNGGDGVDLVLSPKGAGGIFAQKPDGTVAGGDNRGINAVDWQSSRGLASQVASGNFSVVSGGYWNEASSNHAVVGGGSSNLASGSYSAIPGGKSNTAEGLGSTAFGVNNEARGMFSTVSGYYNSGDGDNTFVAGSHNIANDYMETVLGQYASLGYGSTTSWVATDRLFTIGNGTSAGERRSAFTVLKNGNTTIGGTLKVNQNRSMAWYTFPDNRGLPGQAMTTDGDGHAEWTSLNNYGYLTASGNTLGLPISVGTLDNYGLYLITNDSYRITISNSGTIAIPAFTSGGIIHNNASGILSSSLIVNGDISASAAIADSKLATLSTAGKVANSATTAAVSNTSDAIVLRDGSGNFSAGTITASLSGNAATATTAIHLSGGNQGSLPYQTATGASTFLAKGAAGQVLTMNSGATAPQWSTPAGGTVTAVSGTAPVSVATGTTTPVVSISPATSSTAGSMSAADKTKLDAQTTGTAPGQMQYWSGTAWETVAAGTTGQILTVNSSGIPEWKSQLSIITAATYTPIMSSGGIQLKGNFNPNNLASSIYFEYGSSTSYGNTTDVTVYNPHSGNISISASIGSGLNAGDTYHVRLVVKTVLGTFYSNDISFKYLYIGYHYMGGYIFTMDSTGQHGKVCSDNNLSNGATWDDAVELCANYEINTIFDPEYYNDWYLPAVEELQLMYANAQLRTVANLSDGYYWSRDIHGSPESYFVSFYDGTGNFAEKRIFYIVRAVRDF